MKSRWTRFFLRWNLEMRIYVASLRRAAFVSPVLWKLFPVWVRAVRLGFLNKVLAFVCMNLKGRRVLDIGCGNCFYGPVYLLLGAQHYTGCDGRLDLDATSARDILTGCDVCMGVTGHELVQQAQGRLQYVRGGWEDLPEGRQWDVVTMRTVTEHLMDIEGAFFRIAAALSVDGRLVFLHHNFTCWNGHHRKPHRLREIDLTSPDQGTRIDWRHLMDPAAGAYAAKTLNCIRLDELRKLTERFFRIEIWEERPTEPALIRARLSPEIERELNARGFTRRELTTQSVRCVARVAR